VEQSSQHQLEKKWQARGVYMTARKLKFKPDMKNSIDYYNFCTANNDLPILKILNERFSRSFRVSLSNHMRMISNIDYSDQKITFSEWQENNKHTNCIFIMKLQKFSTPLLVKFNRALAYGIIDTLTGGTGDDFKDGSDKEMTQIELSLLKDVGLKLIDDLNIAWNPVHEVKAKYVRTEVNAQFVGIVPPDSKVIKVDFKVNFNNVNGVIEVLYPYSTLFPMRNELFASQ